MRLHLRRVILFTTDLPTLMGFYRDVLGLEVVNREEGWVEFAAGAVSLALHAGRSAPGNRPPKMVFYADDVAATRAGLIARGLTAAGPVKSSAAFDLCDCKDPEGNPFQISSRK